MSICTRNVRFWVLAAAVAAMVCPAAAEFKPLCHGEDNAENRTGLWFCLQVGGAGKALPLPARMYATSDAVTDGVALRVDVSKGQKGTIAYENTPWPAGTAGITLYAKACRPLTLAVRGASVQVTPEWKKINLSWEQLGTTAEKRDTGFEFSIGLAEPAQQDAWYIVDRIGTEGPTFEDAVEVSAADGADKTINTANVMGNAEVLAPTIERLKAKKPFKIIAFGDSVTAGTQGQRGNWSMKPAEVAKYLYFSHLGRLMEEQYGCKVTTVQKGFGGWTAAQGVKVMNDVFAQAGKDDVIIIEFGANDLSVKSVDGWLEDVKVLVDAAKKKTSQVVVLSPTTGGPVPKLADEISPKFRAFAKAENVAWVDFTYWSMYRGEKFAWAYLANDFHPDIMGHVVMAEVMAPLFGTPHFDWPGKLQTPSNK